MSGGQQQRVALARALAPDPDLLLLDEPLAALDVDAAPAMRSLLRRIVRDRKQTAVLVTHSALDALVLADRVVVLTEGAVVEAGPARDVLARPRSAFTARIAGLDLVPGVAAGGGLRTADGLTVAGRTRRGERRRARGRRVPARRGRGVRRPAVGQPAQRAAGAAGRAWSRWATSCGCGRPPRPGGPPWVDGLAADVTAAAVAELTVEPGADLWFVVKAAEVGDPRPCGWVVPVKERFTRPRSCVWLPRRRLATVAPRVPLPTSGRPGGGRDPPARGDPGAGRRHDDTQGYIVRAASPAAAASAAGDVGARPVQTYASAFVGLRRPAHAPTSCGGCGPTRACWASSRTGRWRSTPPPLAEGTQDNPPNWGLDRIDQRGLPARRPLHDPGHGPRRHRLRARHRRRHPPPRLRRPREPARQLRRRDDRRLRRPRHRRRRDRRLHGPRRGEGAPPSSR